MDNYVYLIAGFPELILDYANHNLTYKEFIDVIRDGCSKKDNRLIDWLEFGFDENNLNNHFYREVKKSKSKFLLEYFTFDMNLRNTAVERLSNGDPKYIVGEYNSEFDEFGTICSTLSKSNLIEREQALDKIRWNKISEITLFNYFDIDRILAFLAKLKIVERWEKLDHEKGRELFKELVAEVRGSFKGVEFE